MRAAGCTLNDIFDRNFDARVERTRGRPLPSGAIGLKGAVAFMAVLLGAGLAILLQLNLFAVLLGAGSLLLVVVYPLISASPTGRKPFWDLRLTTALCWAGPRSRAASAGPPGCSMPAASPGPWATTRSTPIRTRRTTSWSG